MTDVDEDLVRLAIAGHRPAFESLVRRTTRLVWATLLLQTGDRALAEDLTQETFLRAWRSIGTLKAADAFRPWLLRIAEHVRLDEFKSRTRKRRTKPSKTRAADPPSSSPSPPDVASLNDEKQRVLAALKQLPDAYQQALSLRYLGGADYEQMERELALTNGSLRGLLHRGLEMLRDRLGANSAQLNATTSTALPPNASPSEALSREAGQP